MQRYGNNSVKERRKERKKGRREGREEERGREEGSEDEIQATNKIMVKITDLLIFLNRNSIDKI